MLTIETPATPAQILTVSEMRQAVGVSDGSQDSS